MSEFEDFVDSGESVVVLDDCVGVELGVVGAEVVLEQVAAGLQGGVGAAGD